MDIMNMIQNPTIIWIAIAVVFAIIEACTLGITCIWFAAGAGIAAVCSLIGMGVPLQIVVFVLVSIILLIVTKPLASKYINGKVTATNIDALMGKKATVVEIIPSNGKGRVRLDGKLWSAQLPEGASSSAVDKGTIVEVMDVSGVTLIVRSI